jgi:hypothetical protein
MGDAPKRRARETVTVALGTTSVLRRQSIPRKNQGDIREVPLRAFEGLASTSLVLAARRREGEEWAESDPIERGL